MILQQAALRVAVPIVTRWIHAQEQRILARGEPLHHDGLTDARSIGIMRPEKIRLLRVGEVPLPLNWIAKRLAPFFGMLGDRTAGLTAGYGIFVRSDHWGDRALIAHELAHVRQYEVLGGVRPFLEQYLSECLWFGYENAPLEHEAAERASAAACQSSPAGNCSDLGRRS